MSVRLPLGNNNDHQVIMAAGLQLTRQTVLLALGGITLPLLIPLAQVHRYLPFFNSYSRGSVTFVHSDLQNCDNVPISNCWVQ